MRLHRFICVKISYSALSFDNPSLIEQTSPLFHLKRDNFVTMTLAVIQSQVFIIYYSDRVVLANRTSFINLSLTTTNVHRGRNLIFFATIQRNVANENKRLLSSWTGGPRSFAFHCSDTAEALKRVSDFPTISLIAAQYRLGQ